MIGLGALRLLLLRLFGLLSLRLPLLTRLWRFTLRFRRNLLNNRCRCGWLHRGHLAVRSDWARFAVAVPSAPVTVAAMSFAPPKANLLLLDWANKAQDAKPPGAVLIELDLKDETPTDWSGRTTVAGAKVVRIDSGR